MSTTKQLEELVGRKNGRLDDLRTAVLPVAALLARCKRPSSSTYKIYVRHQRTNVGSCDWLMVENLASDTECWTPELHINETGGYVHGDFDAPYPCGPTPRQLRAFAAWLSCPDTLAAYVTEEQAAEQADLSAIDKLTAMAAAVEPNTMQAAESAVSEILAAAAAGKSIYCGDVEVRVGNRTHGMHGNEYFLTDLGPVHVSILRVKD